MALKKALMERALSGEMNRHLGYPPGAAIRIYIAPSGLHWSAFEASPWGQKFPTVVAVWRCTTSRKNGAGRSLTGKPP